jgi:hypothetical protein
VTRTLELWVEGVTDARYPAITSRGSEQIGASVRPERPLGGALVPVLRKALEASGKNPPVMDAVPLKHRLAETVSFGGGRRKQPELSNYARKVLVAIQRARSRDQSKLILAVWDRDGRDEPLQDRDGLHEVFRSSGEDGAAVAVCVEEIEAWLLADPAAFRRCFGRGPRAGLPGAPEEEPHPKERLASVLQDLEIEERDMAALYRKLAEHVDVDTLTKHCPRGFGELRKALRELIEPCLASSVS